MASEVVMVGACGGLNVNVLAPHAFPFCYEELSGTEGELLNFSLPCSRDCVWVRKVKIVCTLSLGCWIEDIVFL